ncbi:MAG: hypothetical protein K8I02_02270 [Candidatus Methylomirabilis sp.]|nr:hypothetical protein [Deltaproteobacteria bacterium]
MASRSRRYMNRKLTPCAPLTPSERQAVDSLDEANTLLPDQFFISNRAHPGFESEKKLMIAVLMDAIKTYKKNLSPATKRGANLLAETEAWLFGGGEGEEDWLYSFENICETLGLDAENVRGRLRGLREVLVEGKSLPEIERSFAEAGLL